MKIAADLAAALNGRRAGRGWMGRCPAHNDRTPSLSIAEGRDGRPLLFCFAGCEWPDIRDALRARGLWSDGGDRAVPHSNPTILISWHADRDGDHRKQSDVARRLWAGGHPVTDRDPGMDDWLIDINDLSQQLKIPPKTIRNKLSDGTWPLEPVRIGRALRWRQAEVDRLKRGEMLGAGTDEA